MGRKREELGTRLALPQSKDGDDLIRQRSPRVELCLSFVTSQGKQAAHREELRGGGGWVGERVDQLPSPVSTAEALFLLRSPRFEIRLSVDTYIYTLMGEWGETC